MYQPLSEQLRPRSLQEIVGQNHLLGKEGVISHIISSRKPLSIILWGPPGSGKTSIAPLYAKAFDLRYESFSAVLSGISEIKKIVQDAKTYPLFHKGTLIFVDEIHRFNKAQQDAFLPLIESGEIILVGATTENPSFHLNNALLSRVRVLTVNPLSEDALNEILTRYEAQYSPLPLTDKARKLLLTLAQGDGRYLFNMIENIRTIPLEKPIDEKMLRSSIQKRVPLYDRDGEFHYNLISALHKSIRGSDPNAALYWLCRMLEGGEDPLFIVRRLIRAASEDVGLADPDALKVALSAKEAYEMLGSPEGELAIAQAVIYLSLAPKSNAIYTAFKMMQKKAADTSHLSPPAIILNAPTKLMRDMGYGEGYRYDHDTPEGFSGQNYFPEDIERIEAYQPVERGFEREMKKRIEYFNRLRKINKTSSNS